MEATISADNVKTLQNCLSCLSKINDSINWQANAPHPQQSQSSTHSSRGSFVRISAINAGFSGICAIDLDEAFFDSIRVRHPQGQVTCEIKVKPLLTSLKVATSGGGGGLNLTDRRKLERCQISIIDAGAECRIVVRVHYTQGVVRTQKLTYEQKAAQFPSDRPGDGSFVAVHPQMALTWLHHFSAIRGAEVTIWAHEDNCSVRSKSDEYAPRDGTRKARMTQVTPVLEDFAVYQVKREAYITFNLKEFRAIAQLAEAMNEVLELRFTTDTYPLFINVASSSDSIYANSSTQSIPSVRCEMVLATSPAPQRGMVEAETSAPAAQSYSNGPRELTPQAQDAANEVSRSKDAAVDAVPLDEGADFNGGPNSQPPPSAGADLQPPHESTPRAVSASATAAPLRHRASSPPPRLHASVPAPLPSQEDTNNGLFLGGALPSTQEQGVCGAGESSRAMPPPPLRAGTQQHRAARSEAAIQRLTNVHHSRREIDWETQSQLGGSSRTGTGAGQERERGEEEQGQEETEDFDYGGVLDEVEGGIGNGHIQVHGSHRQEQEKEDASRTVDETHRQPSAAIQIEERDDHGSDDQREQEADELLPGSADELEEELPATQPSAPQLQPQLRSTATSQRASGMTGGTAESGGAKRKGQAAASSSGEEEELQQQQGGGGEKRFKPMFG